MAATGQRSDDVFPRKIFMPFLNGSVFDCLMVILIILGAAGSSTATSP